MQKGERESRECANAVIRHFSIIKMSDVKSKKKEKSEENEFASEQKMEEKRVRETRRMSKRPYTAKCTFIKLCNVI